MVTAVRAAPKQPSVSASDIKAKLEAKRKQEGDQAQKTIATKLELSGQKPAQKIDQDSPDPIIGKSDVAKNDANDPVTQEKLKALIKNGGFSFNSKEKEVLSQILEA
jgi:hypothetical protein